MNIRAYNPHTRILELNQAARLILEMALNSKTAVPCPDQPSTRLHRSPTRHDQIAKTSVKYGPSEIPRIRTKAFGVLIQEIGQSSLAWL